MSRREESHRKTPSSIQCSCLRRASMVFGPSNLKGMPELSLGACFAQESFRVMFQILQNRVRAILTGSEPAVPLAAIEERVKDFEDRYKLTMALRSGRR